MMNFVYIIKRPGSRYRHTDIRSNSDIRTNNNKKGLYNQCYGRISSLCYCFIKISDEKNYKFYGVYLPGQLPSSELETERKHRVYLISLPPGINCERSNKFTGELN